MFAQLFFLVFNLYAYFLQYKNKKIKFDIILYYIFCKLNFIIYLKL